MSESILLLEEPIACSVLRAVYRRTVLEAGLERVVAATVLSSYVAALPWTAAYNWVDAEFSRITEQTFYRWRAKYGGMQVSEAKRLKALEDENRRLKRLMADLSLDNAMLKDVVGRTV